MALIFKQSDLNSRNHLFGLVVFPSACRLATHSPVRILNAETEENGFSAAHNLSACMSAMLTETGWSIRCSVCVWTGWFRQLTYTVLLPDCGSPLPKSGAL
jgi:hypothetical protein